MAIADPPTILFAAVAMPFAYNVVSSGTSTHGYTAAKELLTFWPLQVACGPRISFKAVSTCLQVSASSF